MNDTVQTFQCPSCGASLEPPSGAATMKCGYCGTSVVIPEAIRSTPQPQAGLGSMSSLSLDFGTLMAKAIRMGEVVRLTRNGDRTDAIKLYQENSGASLEQAEKVIDAIASGHGAEVMMGPEAGEMGRVIAAAESAREMRTEVQQARRGRRSGCAGTLSIIIVVAAIIIAIQTSPGPAHDFVNGLIAQFNPAAFAKPLLTFGAQGSGAGMLDDPRSVAVSPDGTIYVADYSDGRIQSFDPTGKFIALVSAGTKTTISRLAAGRNGKLYAVYSGEIWIYNARTQQLEGKLAYDQDHYFSDAIVGADGSLYAVSNDEDILRFDQNGRLTLSIPAAISSNSGDSELDTHIAVDGLGNIYALGAFNYAVFKFSPDGKYINRFGSEGDGQGQFSAPEAIAVDGYGRVFVSDFSGVQVFDSNGVYQKSFDTPSSNVVFGMVFDDQNNLYAVTNGPSVVKLQLVKP
jgi:streptogramin lyase/predicted RNA-binding Zn-ribbon protein involved in translation (DUF1610 family)